LLISSVTIVTLDLAIESRLRSNQALIPGVGRPTPDLLIIQNCGSSSTSFPLILRVSLFSCIS